MGCMWLSLSSLCSEVGFVWLGILGRLLEILKVGYVWLSALKGRLEVFRGLLGAFRGEGAFRREAWRRREAFRRLLGAFRREGAFWREALRREREAFRRLLGFGCVRFWLCGHIASWI